MEKTKDNRKNIKANMDATHGGFHPHEASIYDGLKDADRAGIYETLKKIPVSAAIALAMAERKELKRPLKEFVGHSGALTTGFTGAAGFDNLLPDIIYTQLYENARCADITPLVSNIVECPGSQLKLDVEVDGSFSPNFSASGGETADETIETAQGTITPRLFNINVAITNEMIEDQLFDVMATHMAIAAKAMGEFSTKMCLFPIMDDHRATATTYRIEGDYNTVSTGGDYWYASDILEAEGENATDGFPGGVLILPPHGAESFLKGEGAGNPIPPFDIAGFNLNEMPIGNWCGIPFVRCTHITTSDTPAAVQYYSGLYSTEWHALLVNKTHGIQTVRKRWLKIENYSDPIKDLVGAVISARQGHFVAYADACCVISGT
jgi:hypothetical protein